MKSATFFNQLMGIDTLLSLDGVIPSLSDFQRRLITLLEQFNNALIAENSPPEQRMALCRLLCSYLDKRIELYQQNKSTVWQRHALTHHFYGDEAPEHSTPLSEQLSALITTHGKSLDSFARTMMAALGQIEGHNETLSALRAAHPLRPKPPDNQPTPPKTSQRALVFIIGPFAGKWFNQSDLIMDGDSAVTWALAADPATLAARLAHLESHPETPDILTFFPLLADGFERNQVLVEHIKQWQRDLASQTLQRRLPCMVGLYTRLSLQRSPHDPDRAVWTGTLTTQSRSTTTLEVQLSILSDELRVRDDGGDIYDLQRRALGHTLLSWLSESRAEQALQELFDASPLCLTSVTLADYGQGFTRHGSWSRWLAERYGILPGLSSTLDMPPLPKIRLASVADATPIAKVPLPETPESPRRRWPKIAALLLALAALAGGLLYLYAHLNTQDVIGNTSSEDNLKSFTLSGAMPMFEKGSSTLIPGSEKKLTEIVPEITRTPGQIFLIIGHSDNTGSSEINMTLSIERARTIQKWLVAHTGLPANRFIVKGAGNSSPLASNNTREGRAQNRRVEIIPLSTSRQ